MMNNFKIQKVCNHLFYIFVFLIPWQTRYIYAYLQLKGENFEYGKLGIYLSEIFLLLLVLIFVFFRSRFSKINKMPKIFLVFFFFLVFCSINYFFALNKELYFYHFFKIIELIALFFIFSKIKVKRFKVIMAFLLSMLGHSFLALFQFYSQYIGANKYLGIAEKITNQGGVSVLEGFYGRLLRAYGGFPHPNILGGFLVISILLLIYLYFHKKEEKSLKFQIFFWASLIIFFNVLVLTFSRSAALALLISMFLLFIYVLIKKKVKIWGPIFIVLIILSAINFIFFKDYIYTRVKVTERLELKSQNERILFRNQAQELLKDNWLLGVGLNNYTYAVYQNVNQNLAIYDYQPVHNIYLLILVELGIGGLILYLLLFFRALHQLRNSKDIIFPLILISILLISFFDHYFWTSWSGLSLSFLMLFMFYNKEG
ncbi:O-antigen ligase family protein [bacterium]|nr:O-antigen ligase family protein [bacterium]